MALAVLQKSASIGEAGKREEGRGTKARPVPSSLVPRPWIMIRPQISHLKRDSMKTKVTVVGGGNVGATVAQGIALKELADVVVVDIVEGVPQGKTLDLMETAPVEKYDSILRGT